MYNCMIIVVLQHFLNKLYISYTNVIDVLYVSMVVGEGFVIAIGLVCNGGSFNLFNF